MNEGALLKIPWNGGISSPAAVENKVRTLQAQGFLRFPVLREPEAYSYTERFK